MKLRLFGGTTLVRKSLRQCHLHGVVASEDLAPFWAIAEDQGGFCGHLTASGCHRPGRSRPCQIELAQNWGFDETVNTHG